MNTLSFLGASALALAVSLVGCDGAEADGAGGAGSGATESTTGSRATGDATASTSDATAASSSSTGLDDPMIPSEHPRIYLNEAQRARLGAAWTANTPAATRFRDFVDARLGGGDPYAFAGWHAALVYVLTGDADYADLAIQEVDDYVLAEEALIASGERADVSADSYLYVGDHVGDAMLVYDWCFDRLTADQRTRWAAWANQAVWNVWHPDEATWGGEAFPWSGWSVDDPVNNYYFSFLRATVLLGLATYEENPDAPGWIDQFRDTKIQEQLVPRYMAELEGGGSREGTGYGTAMAGLFRLYDLWGVSTGERIADLTSHARLSTPYLVHAIVPTLDRLAPIGDHARDSTAALFDYHRDYLQVLGALYPDDQAVHAARTLLAESSVPEMGQGFMRFSDFLHDASGGPAAPLSTLYPAYHATGTGHVFARSGWTPDATWIGLIAGPYSQSHAHHDQGSLLVYAGEWLAYDANVDSHSGIRQEEELHNLVRIESGGSTVRMREGASPAVLTALTNTANLFYYAADVTPIYDGQAPIQRVFREVAWIKPGAIVVRDVVTTSDPAARRVYQLNTPIDPTVNGRVARMQGTASSLDLFVVEPASGPIDVVSWAGADADMNGGYRVEVARQGEATSTFVTVLGTGGAVTAASGAGGMVTVTLAGGRTATVTFADGAPPTVDVQGAGAFTETPAAVVESWPILAP